MNRTRSAKVKHTRKNRNIGRSKVLDRAINTKLERRIQQIAQNEIDKNKKQKILIRTLCGRVTYPTISAEEYHEAKFAGIAQIFRDDLKHDAIDGGSYRRFIWNFPQIRCLGADVDLETDGMEQYKKYGANSDIMYLDNDEIGNVRSGDEIIFKGFKISGVIYPNSNNKEDDIEIDLAVYKLDSQFDMNEPTVQYMLAQKDQALIMPKRLINDYLGSDSSGNALRPNTEGIKKRIFHKHWNLNVRQDLYDKNDVEDLIYNPKEIPFSYYIDCEQKIKYVRSEEKVANGTEQRSSNIAINAGLNLSGDIVERIKFENVKYCIVCKSNITKSVSNKVAPYIALILTSYFTDIN